MGVIIVQGLTLVGVGVVVVGGGDGRECMSMWKLLMGVLLVVKKSLCIGSKRAREEERAAETIALKMLTGKG